MNKRISEVMEDFQQLHEYYVEMAEHTNDRDAAEDFNLKATKYQGVTEGLAIALGLLQEGDCNE